MKTEEAIDYIRCATEFSKLSALLMDKVANEKKGDTEAISREAGDALYWLWKLYNEYLDQNSIKKSIEKYENEDTEV